MTFCPFLWNSVYIDFRGDVYNCCQMVQKIGNIYTHHLRESINSKEQLRLRECSQSGRLKCAKGCSIIADEYKKERSDLHIGYHELERLKFHISEFCNIGCIMCTQEHANREVLDIEKACEHIDVAPFSEIAIEGGEPLAIEATRHLFRHMVNQGKQVNILTNGLLIDSQWASRIARHSEYIYISVNAATKATHEKVNRGSSFNQVMENIGLLRRQRDKSGSNLRIRGHMTIVPQNLHEIPSFIHRFKELGFDTIDFGFDGSITHLLDTKPRIRKVISERARRRYEDSMAKECINTSVLRLLELI